MSLSLLKVASETFGGFSSNEFVGKSIGRVGSMVRTCSVRTFCHGFSYGKIVAWMN